MMRWSLLKVPFSTFTLRESRIDSYILNKRFPRYIVNCVFITVSM